MIVAGSKSSKGGGSSSSGSESPNSLRSNAKARIIELLGEGEIVGLVDAAGEPVTSENGGTAIFFGETAAQNENGSWNFKGLTWQQRVGLPDQDHLNGFTMAETPVDVGVQVTNSGGPVVRSIVDANADAARVIIRIPALAFTNKTSGDLKGASVSYAIDVRPAGGEWENVHVTNIEKQKCTSPYQRAHRIPKPDGATSWDLRVRRLTEDSEILELQNETHWDSYILLTEGKFIYPDTALIALEVDAQQFGNSMPGRAYRVKGLKTQVPSNYNPVTRAYTGVWDGTFVKSWHSNPVWVMWDLLRNNRYGLGEFIEQSIVDKWNFYTIGQYCDELIPSGYFDGEGDPILEPRFAFHGVINSRQEAYKVLQMVSAAFRAMAFWSLGQVMLAADMPRDPVTVLSPANVIDGRFRYSGTALKARHTVALVSWNDPNDFFRPAIEVVQNDDMIARFGWRQIEAQAFGCISRGQAHRFGKWILDTEEHETETVEFEMSWDGYILENNLALKPGDVILISDPRKTGGVRTGGRLAAVADASHFTLDAPYDVEDGVTYSVTVLLPSGKLEKKTIESFAAGDTQVVLEEALSETPVAGAMFVIQSTTIAARQYTVRSVEETDIHTFRVTALFHDPQKFDRVEQGIKHDPISYTRPRNTVQAPTNLSLVESRYLQNGVTHSRATLSWTPPNDFLAVEFAITADSPRGFVNVGRTNTTSIDINDPDAGDWTFYVSAMSHTGLVSAPATDTFTLEGWEAVEVPVVSSLEILGGGTTFGGTAPTVTWEITFPEDAVVYEPECVVRVYDAANNLLRTELVAGTTYTYDLEKNINDGGPRRALRIDVTAKGVTGIESAPTTVSINNPTPAAITPVLNSAPGSLEITYAPPADSDFAGARIWMSTTSGFTPGSGNLVYDGPDTKVTLFVEPGTYYVRAAAYDAFGTGSLNVSAEVSITITSVDQKIAAALPALIEAQGAASIVDLEDLAESLATLQAQMIQSQDENFGLFQRSIQLLAAAQSGLSASIAQESYARVTGDLAEATQRQLLQAQINDDVLAAIATEQTARADADSALASSVSVLATQVGDNQASLTTVAESVDGISVRYGVIGTIDGETGGFVFTGVQQLDGTVDFDLMISGDVIVDGTITGDKIAANTITADKVDANILSAAVIHGSQIVADSITVDRIDSNAAIYNAAKGLAPGTTVNMPSINMQDYVSSPLTANKILQSTTYTSVTNLVWVVAAAAMPSPASVIANGGINSGSTTTTVTVRVEIVNVDTGVTLNSFVIGTASGQNQAGGNWTNLNGIRFQSQTLLSVPADTNISVRLVGYLSVTHSGLGANAEYVFRFSEANILMLEPRGQ